MIANIQIKIPVMALPPGAYARKHLDLQLTPQQATTLQMINLALQQTGAKLQSGKFVGASTDTAKWILEQIGDQSIIGEKISAEIVEQKSKKARK